VEIGPEESLITSFDGRSNPAVLCFRQRKDAWISENRRTRLRLQDPCALQTLQSAVCFKAKWDSFSNIDATSLWLEQSEIDIPYTFTIIASREWFLEANIAKLLLGNGNLCSDELHQRV